MMVISMLFSYGHVEWTGLDLAYKLPRYSTVTSIPTRTRINF
jgi:hypothetical protein